MSIRINVDPSNPGQFFACCGLLELADRLWRGTEGWFIPSESVFSLTSCETTTLLQLLSSVREVGLRGELSPALQAEREELEKRRRQVKKTGKELERDEEERRKELGTLLRSGAISIDQPFNLRLDWWQGGDEQLPKTWAGRQEVLRIADSALNGLLEAFATESPFDYACVMRLGSDESEEAKDEQGKVEPFYFDARRGTTAMPLDIGFSPDSLKMVSLAYPAVEFLALVGFQRFRPMATARRRVYDYQVWTRPLAASVAPVAACGLLADLGGQVFRFENAFRTDQKKHKAFKAATPVSRRNNGQSTRAI